MKNRQRLVCSIIIAICTIVTCYNMITSDTGLLLQGHSTRYLYTGYLDIGDTNFTVDHLVPVLQNNSELKSIYIDRYKGNAKGKSCTPNRNIAFLKVHKAGSTTIQNILQRMSLHHRLNVVLPNTKDTRKSNDCYHYINIPRPVQTFSNGSLKSVIPIAKHESYNMLFNHMVYKKETWDALFPKDVYRAAIVREPESRFLSAINYWPNFVARFKGKISMHLAHPETFTRNHYNYNSLSYDFGIPSSDYKEPDKIVNHVHTLSGEFDFVMVMEYFDQSLVLLKRRLCWDLKDIVYLIANARAIPKIKLTTIDKTNLVKWQAADVIVYKTFYELFWRKVQTEGPDFHVEVEYFKNIISYVFNYCKTSNHDQPLYFKQSRWNEPFSINKSDCDDMSTVELDFHDHLVDAAWKRVQTKK